MFSQLECKDFIRNVYIVNNAKENQLHLHISGIIIPYIEALLFMLFDQVFMKKTQESINLGKNGFRNTHKTVFIMSSVKIHTSQDRLQGSVITETLPSGMTFHMVDAKAVTDFSFEEELKPNFKIAIMFSSTMDMRFGEQKAKLVSRNHHAKLMNFKEPELCSMNVKKGEQRTALYLSVTPDWFERHDIDSKPIRQEINKHFSLEDWALPDMYWQQAESILKYNRDDFNCSMARQGFARSLMSTWVDMVSQARPTRMRVSDKRSSQFEELMRSDEVLYMDFDTISYELGMSTATLQRYSKDVLNMSLSQFLRVRRLEAARKALRYDGASIIEAAFIAGYNHTSNFATAFKRHFGVSPADHHLIMA